MTRIGTLSTPRRLQLTAHHTLSAPDPFERLTEVSWRFDPAGSTADAPEPDDVAVFRTEPLVTQRLLVGRMRLVGRLRSDAPLVPVSVSLTHRGSSGSPATVARTDTWLLAHSGIRPAEIDLGPVAQTVPPGRVLELRLWSPALPAPAAGVGRSPSRLTLQLGGRDGAGLVWE